MDRVAHEDRRDGRDQADTRAAVEVPEVTSGTDDWGKAVSLYALTLAGGGRLHVEASDVHAAVLHAERTGRQVADAGTAAPRAGITVEVAHELTPDEAERLRSETWSI
jgi:hypothetical protein